MMAHSFYLLLALLLHLMAQRALCCMENHLISSDYRQMYCDADIVFRGSPSMAMSSVGIDEDGRQMQASKHSFNIQEWYRYYGDHPPNQKTVAVGRSWQESDPCDSAPFPDPTGTGSFLVFASRTGSYYTVLETCRHSFPWDCLPDNFKSSLPIVC
ncbi:hypothetical protein ElyMa_005604900 [Elysia marginata]|uniref:Secreted protein n=1 Tax=Elysia marginata TaxID=1093978 RepID=A0AAV4F4X4_9GAST|nr:hypothetical protein ElyMa_005604900 [Elysia marginata]